MSLNGVFPHDDYGNSVEIFSSFTEAMPIVTFILSVMASAFGISKFFVVGPLKLLSQDTPLSGILSFSFLAHLFVNFGFMSHL